MNDLQIWQIIKRVGISNLKLLKLLESWLSKFFNATGKDKLEALFKIAALSSRQNRNPLLDSKIIQHISTLLSAASLLEKQGLETFAQRLTRRADKYLESLLYKLLPSMEKKILYPEEETEL